MINSIKIAADFIHRLPRGGMSPETTAGRDGFVHPYVMSASVEQTSVRFIIRDFVTAALAERKRSSRGSRTKRWPNGRALRSRSGSKSPTAT
jgi:tripeptide aminopeptidase